MSTLSSLKIKTIFVSIIFFTILNISSLYAATECISAFQTGMINKIVVPANPELSVDKQYVDGVISQRGFWTDSNLNTNGEPFYFEISGMWTPWSDSYDSISVGNEESAYNKILQIQNNTNNSQFYLSKNLIFVVY